MSSEDFIEIMDELGRRIEGPAQKVYELAIRQVYVELIIAVVLFTIALVLVLKLVKPALRHNAEWKAKYEEAKERKAKEPYSGYVSSYEYSFFENESVLAISSGMSIAFLLFASINLLANLTGALNPGWKALHMILRSIT